MNNENNLSTPSEFDERIILETLEAALHEVTQFIEKKHIAGTLIYPSELSNLASIENSTLKENVKKIWKNIRRNPSNLNDVAKGYTSSKHFEVSTNFLLFQGPHPVTSEPVTLDSQHILTYVLKPGVKPSEALNDFLNKSKTIIDCQTAATLALHYALYHFLTHTFKDDGKNFDLLFGEGNRKLVLSKYGVTYDTSESHILHAPFTLIRYFLKPYHFSGKENELEPGDYVFFLNNAHYSMKHPTLSDQGAAGFYLPKKSKDLFYSFGLGLKTKDEIRKHFLISYNKPALNEKKAEKNYPETVTLKDIPGLQEGFTFYRFDVEKIKILCEQIKNGNLLDYLKELDEWALREIQSLEEKRYPLICRQMGWPLPLPSIKNTLNQLVFKPPATASSNTETQDHELENNFTESLEKK